MINPYNYRSPVAKEEQLAGRQRELNMLDERFALVESKRPSHLLFEGPQLRGKTSMLNVGAGRAKAHGLLPVQLILSPAHFDDSAGLFRAMIAALEAALHALKSTQSSRADQGEAELQVAFPEFETLKESRFIPGLAETDIERAAEYVSACGKKGVVFLIDDSQHLEYADYTTLQGLDVLLQQHISALFVFAGDVGTVDLLFEHSYSLGQRLEVVSLGYLKPSDVRQLILGNDSNLPEATRITRATAYDLWLLAREGEPYWLMVVASLIWEEREDDEFRLSAALIREVTVRQEHAMSGVVALADAVTRIDEVKALPADLLDHASRLAPYEAMTVSECVLAQRAKALGEGEMPQTSYQEDLDSTEGVLNELVRRGLIEQEEDRFRVAGDTAIKLFLRYEAYARDESKSAGSAEGHGRYGTAAVPGWLEVLGRDLAEVKDPSTSLLATYMGVGDPERDPTEVGAPFESMQEAADEGNPVALAAAGFRPVSIVSLQREYDFSRDRKLAYVGIVFGVGIDDEFTLESERVACGWLRWAVPDASSAEFASGVQRWLESHEDELGEYRLKPLKVVAGVLDRDLTDRTVALMSPFTVPGVVIGLFRDGKLHLAASYLKQVIDAFELGRESSRTPWTYSMAIVDAYVRLGFIAALIGRSEDAGDALRRCLELYREIGGPLTDQLVLARHNLAYVWAKGGQYAKAASFAEETGNLPQEEAPGAFMLLYLPTPTSWIRPSDFWNTTSVEGEAISSVIQSQARAYEALAGKYDRSEFLARIADESRSISAAGRIFGWTLLTHYGDYDGAAKEFSGALELASDSERLVLERELEFASAGGGV